MPRPEVSPADDPAEVEALPPNDTAEHDTLREALDDAVPPRPDPPEGERADPHTPPLDRLEDYVQLERDDPRRVEAARLLGVADDAPNEAESPPEAS
jgi:hypothetical protein